MGTLKTLGRGFVVLSAAALLVASTESGAQTTWEQVVFDGHGVSTTTFTKLVAFGDRLYAGTRDETAGSGVLATGDGNTWEWLKSPSPGSYQVTALQRFGDALYVALAGGSSGCEVWRTTDGTAWSRIDNGCFGGNGLSMLAAYDGFLFAYVPGVEPATVRVYRSPEAIGFPWEDMGPTTPAHLPLGGVVVFGGYLYGQTSTEIDPARVWRSSDGVSWTQVSSTGFGSAENSSCGIAVHGNRLVAGTVNSNGCEVWTTVDGTIWESIATGGFGDPENQDCKAMASFGGGLIVGTKHLNAGLELWRWDEGVGWSMLEDDGWADPDRFSVESVAAFDGTVYAAVSCYCTTPSRGGEVWRAVAGACWPGIGLTTPPSEDPQVWALGRTISVNGGTGENPGCPPVESIFWAWGDGTTELAFFPSIHQYAAGGAYVLTVTSCDQSGECASDAETIDVGAAVLFSDSFETGDLSAWSGSVP